MQTTELGALAKDHRVLIAPSILSADFARLGEEIKAVEAAGADVVHVDVMDGMFVPNITIGPVVVGKIRRVTSLPLDVHLMVQDPGRYAADFIRAGADTLCVHVEACTHLHRTIQQIHELSAKLDKKATGRTFTDVVPGVALNPHTPVSMIENIVGDIGMVIVMTVNPGFGGQKYITGCEPKIAHIRALLDAANPGAVIEVDGGINPATAASAASHGANMLVAGAAVYGAPDYAAAIKAIREGATAGG
ncbi:MAG: ribulose-phosphate 3-epimerase [Myxococcota bacterium]|jgi:ribulose-phosphate 3-epimerase